jgi:hypothetical protein
MDANNDNKAEPDVGAYEATTISLALVKDLEQGKSPVFAVSGDTATNPTAIFFFTFLPAGSATWPIYALDPVGSLSIDMTSILWTTFSPVPSIANWQPLGTLPVDPNFTGAKLYAQVIGISKGAYLKPSGRVDLNL